MVIKAQWFEIIIIVSLSPTFQNETILVFFFFKHSVNGQFLRLTPLLSFNLIKLYSLNLLLRNAAVVLCSVRVSVFQSNTVCWATFQKAELQNYKTLFWMMSCSLIEQWRKKNIILAQKINPFFMTFRSLSWYANIQGVPTSFGKNLKHTQ